MAPGHCTGGYLPRELQFARNGRQWGSSCRNVERILDFITRRADIVQAEACRRPRARPVALQSHGDGSLAPTLPEDLYADPRDQVVPRASK